MISAKFLFLLVLSGFENVNCEVKPTIREFEFPQNVQSGERVSTTCTIKSGQQPLEFQWLKDGLVVIPTEEIRIETDEYFSVLVIKPATVGNIGNYTCIVKNRFDSDEHTAQLMVQAAPSWLTEPYSTKTTIGFEIKIPCKASGNPKPMVTWSKMGSNIRILSDTLHLQFVTKNHSGEYMCTIKNGIGEGLTKRVSVSVNVPAKFEEKFSVKTVKKGEKVKLDCSATGDQPLTITWTKETNKLNARSERYSIIESLTEDGISSELTIYSVDRSEGGIYICSAQNSYGTDERTNKLLVLEAPGTPTNLVAQKVWSRTVSLAWKSPFTGNSPITGYVVQYWTDETKHGSKKLNEKTVSSSHTSLLVKELEPGSYYEAAIVAENDVGRGPPSNLIRFKTGEEEPSMVPLNVAVESRWPTTIKISWQDPPIEGWNGKLIGYHVGYRSSFNSPFSYRIVPVEGKSGYYEYFLNRLTKETDFTVTVKAYNSAGIGPGSQETVVKTMSGDLPAAPQLYVKGTTRESISLYWKTNGQNLGKLNSYTIYYKNQDEISWNENTIPIDIDMNDGNYVLDHVIPSTVYKAYMTLNSNYGQGDPSQILRIKTRGHRTLSKSLSRLVFELDMVTIASVAIALVIIVAVIIMACVYVRMTDSGTDGKGGHHPSIDMINAALTLQRNSCIEDDKGGEYIGTSSQAYVDLSSGKGSAEAGYPYSTLPSRDSVVSHVSQATPVKPWQRPLPNPNADNNSAERKSIDTPHVYVYPQ